MTALIPFQQPGVDRRKTPEQNDPSVVLFVSVYLLLLAFFLVLNAISQRDSEKVKAAMGSVAATFTPLKQPLSDVVDLLNDSTDVVGNDTLATDIIRLFDSMVDVPGYHASIDGNVLEISFPADELFYDFSHIVRDRHQPLMKKIATILSIGKAGYRNELRIALDWEKEAKAATTLATDLSLIRAGSAASRLISLGVPPDSVVSGLIESKGRRVHLIFATVRPARPPGAPPEKAP